MKRMVVRRHISGLHVAEAGPSRCPHRRDVLRELSLHDLGCTHAGLAGHRGNSTMQLKGEGPPKLCECGPCSPHPGLPAPGAAGCASRAGCPGCRPRWSAAPRARPLRSRPPPPQSAQATPQRDWALAASLPCCSMGCTCQPDMAACLAAAPLGRHSGFLNKKVATRCVMAASNITARCGNPA